MATHEAGWIRSSLKIFGVLLTLIPVGLIAIIAIAEIVDRQISGLFELMLTLPLIALAVIAWRRPRLGALLLWSLGISLGVWYLIDKGNRTAALMLFGPPLLAGLLFFLADTTEQHEPS
jgi:ABC-type uncharacterized transport system permease subunit